MLARSPSDFGCAEARAGHSNDDFESMGLPSYQHFRPSIRRQDQYPCGSDGLVPVHFCFACAGDISTIANVTMQAAKAINGICVLTQHLRSEIACEVQPKRGVAEPSLAFKFGRSGSKIGPALPLRGSRKETIRQYRSRRSMAGPRLCVHAMSKMEDAALLVVRCTMATLLVKVDDLQFASLRVLIDPKNYPRHMLGCAAWFG
jgi:hypothetical protein